MEKKTIVVMEGDQTGQELLEEALRVLDPAVSQLELDFQRFDLSLENRKATDNQVVHEAAEAMRETGFGIKAATVTPETGSLGSPNAILRKGIDGTVIVRTGRRIPGINPMSGVHAPISVVRMAVDDAYGAKEWREGEDVDEMAYRTEQISRPVCRGVSEFSFLQARKMKAKVFGGPKYTVSPVYEGMLKEEMDRAAGKNRDTRYDPQLIDATYALLLGTYGEPLVIPTLNRDGDCLSDMVLQMFGSIAGAESLLISLDEEFAAQTIMSEAPHGTAPALEGKNVANPMAMILAGAALISFIDDDQASLISRAIYEATFEIILDGIRTADLGGSTSTTEFTDEVIRHVKNKREVWSALA
ncbi:MAG: isocitrate/isopropylmalate family dehydrogenase [Rubrobacter sp.]|nr:isocitrate/isopropylmalate family dehydrogenase [Rubrobacter sp.]